jgi:Raffinose synthase or seed imbibition protein Sip1
MGLSWGCAAGLHEGLARLVQGGVPPRLLIIDDGWQCTDVDPPLRPPLSELPLPKKVAERVTETLLSTKEEFVEAELEMLYMGTKDIPAGSELGAHPSYFSPYVACFGVAVHGHQQHSPWLRAGSAPLLFVSLCCLFWLRL